MFPHVSNLISFILELFTLYKNFQYCAFAYYNHLRIAKRISNCIRNNDAFYDRLLEFRITLQYEGFAYESVL